MPKIETIAIVGAGQAGGWAARTLRSEGFVGRIHLVGEENHPPHERPPLSKGVITGLAQAESVHLWDASALEELDLDFRPGVRAVRIDPDTRTLASDDGAVVSYDRLLLATGSRVRTLDVPGADLEGIRYLRTIEDSVFIRDGLAAGRRLLVVGGGWIGLEVAASARTLAVEVALVELADRLCVRTLPTEIAAYVQRLHEGHGVEVHLGRSVQAFEKGGEHAVVAQLDDGSRLAVDLVVIGVGIVPNTSLAEAAGLTVGNGIVVDEMGRTSAAGVFACGDAASFPHPRLARRIRLESWANAQNHAIHVAKAMLDKETRYDTVPWFWSDQYDMNLQILGFPETWGRALYRGEVESGSFSAFFLDGGRIEAMIAINNGRDIPVTRRLMEGDKRVEAAHLANPDLRLKELLKA